MDTWLEACQGNRPVCLPDIPCPACPEAAPLEGAALERIVEASVEWTDAVGCEETGGAAAVADDDQ